MEASIQEQLISGATLLGSAAISSVLTWALTRNKNRADASKSISEAVMNLIDPLNKRIDQQERDICKLRDRVFYLESQVKTFLSYIRELIGVVQRLTRQIVRRGEKPDAELPSWASEYVDEVMDE